MNPFRAARLTLVLGWFVAALSATGLSVSSGRGFDQLDLVIGSFMLGVPAVLLLLLGCLLGFQAARTERGTAHLGDKLFVVSSAMLSIGLIAFLYEAGVWQTLWNP